MTYKIQNFRHPEFLQEANVAIIMDHDSLFMIHGVTNITMLPFKI